MYYAINVILLTLINLIVFFSKLFFLIPLCTILLLSFNILYFNRLNKLQQLNQISTKKRKKDLKDIIFNFIEDIDNSNIDFDTLEKIYISSINLFKSVVTDKQTGLIIEQHFKVLVNNEIKRSERYNLEFSLMLINIMNKKEIEFNKIKETELLKMCGEKFKRCLREVDIVGRLRDKIIILLPQTDIKGAHRAGERILSVNYEIKLNTPSGKSIEPLIAIGVSEFPLNGRNYELLLREAEKNLNQAELLGGNQIIFSV